MILCVDVIVAIKVLLGGVCRVDPAITIEIIDGVIPEVDVAILITILTAFEGLWRKRGHGGQNQRTP